MVILFPSLSVLTRFPCTPVLTSGFAESSSRSYHDGSTNVPEDVEHTISDYDYELDSDLGEEDEPEAWRPCRPKGAKKAGEPSTQPNRPKYNQQYQKVVIKDHAYITYVMAN